MVLPGLRLDAEKRLKVQVAGKVIFVGKMQGNQSVAIGQELVYVSPLTTDYFDELRVPPVK